MGKSYEKKLEEAAIEGVLYKLQYKFKIAELMNYLETCKEIPEAVFNSKKIRDSALKYLILTINNGGNQEALTTAAKLLGLLKVPEETVVKKVADFINKQVGPRKGLPYLFDVIVKTYKVPVNELNVGKMTEAMIFDLHSFGFGTHKMNAWLFCAEYLSLEDKIKMEILQKFIARYVLDDTDKIIISEWTEESLDQAVKTLGISKDQTGKVALDAIFQAMNENVINVDADAVMGILKKFETAKIYVSDDEMKSVINGVKRLLYHDDINGAAKIIQYFGLSKDDFDRNKVLKSISLDTIVKESENSAFLTKFFEISDKEKTEIVRQWLSNLVTYRDIQEVRTLATKFDIPWSEVMTAAENAVIIDLNSYNPDDAVKLIDRYGLSEKFLTSPGTVKLAEKALVRAYSNADTVRINLIKERFTV